MFFPKQTPFEEFLVSIHPDDKELRMYLRDGTWSRVYQDGEESERVVNSVGINSNVLSSDGSTDAPTMYQWVVHVFNPLNAKTHLFLRLKEVRVEGGDVVHTVDENKDQKSVWHDLVSLTSRAPHDEYVMVYRVCTR